MISESVSLVVSSSRRRLSNCEEVFARAKLRWSVRKKQQSNTKRTKSIDLSIQGKHRNSQKTIHPTQMASAPGGATKRLAAVVLSEGLLGDDSVPMAISLLRMSKRRRLAAAEDEGEEERRSSTLVLAMVAAFVLSGRTYAARYGTYVRYYALRNHMAPDLWARFFRFTKDQFDRLYACCRFPPSYFITAASGCVTWGNCFVVESLIDMEVVISHTTHKRTRTRTPNTRHTGTCATPPSRSSWCSPACRTRDCWRRTWSSSSGWAARASLGS